MYGSHDIYNLINYDLDELINRANSGKYLPNKTSSNTASAFAAWVFDLCHIRNKISQRSEEIRFEVAKKREFEISRSLKRLHGCNGFNEQGKWDFVYEDPLNTDSSSIFFIAPNLTINNAPMRCRPDVVLFNAISSNMLIIERKVAVTSIPPPLGCYPNVLAQLWCYSQIDFVDALWPSPKLITLAAEIWTHSRRESDIDGETFFCNSWRKDSREFKYIDRLFSIYKNYLEATL